MSKLKAMLIRHEDLRLKPYLCSKGKITIGVGRNLEARGITTEEAMFLLENDIKRATAAAATFAWFPKLDEVRKDVIVSMVFNLGLTGFCEFKQLISAIENSFWMVAKTEMLDSRWAKQVGDRAIELAEMMLTGRYSS